MTDVLFIQLCKKIVRDYVNKHIDPTGNIEITIDDVYIVWYCKALQNWKALITTSIADGMYYELTYNGDKNEIYTDVYKKWENFAIRRIK